MYREACNGNTMIYNLAVKCNYLCLCHVNNMYIQTHFMLNHLQVHADVITAVITSDGLLLAGMLNTLQWVNLQHLSLFSNMSITEVLALPLGNYEYYQECI